MIDPRWEENAALQAVDLLDQREQAELARTADRDPEIAALVRDYSEAAALLAYAVPQMEPPAQLQARIMESLGAREEETARILPFPRILIPYAIAACLMGLVIYQASLLQRLKDRLSEERVAALTRAPEKAFVPLNAIKLAELATSNKDYAKAKVMVMWDPSQKRGMVSMKNMPVPDQAHTYQMWVLDPTAKAPVSAGVLAGSNPSQLPGEPLAQEFYPSQTVPDKGLGFAISLEPAGGSSSPTPGAVIFAVAPGS